MLEEGNMIQTIGQINATRNKNISIGIWVCLNFVVELVLHLTVTGDVNLITSR